jgi:hypothetical protein
MSVWLSIHIKLVRPSQVKLLMGFQPNFTGVISTIPSCAQYWHIPLLLHKMTTGAKDRKILFSLHRPNYWWDFNQTLED